VDPRAGLDAVEKRETSCSYRESNTGHPASITLLRHCEMVEKMYGGKMEIGENVIK
jgi:hypothetical protein